METKTTSSLTTKRKRNPLSDRTNTTTTIFDKEWCCCEEEGKKAVETGFALVTNGMTRDNKMNDGGVSALSISCPVPFRKQTLPREKDNAKPYVPKDFIEQQSAYFAEVDAFELLEEEVDSINELD